MMLCCGMEAAKCAAVSRMVWQRWRISMRSLYGRSEAVADVVKICVACTLRTELYIRVSGRWPSWVDRLRIFSAVVGSTHADTASEQSFAEIGMPSFCINAKMPNTLSSSFRTPKAVIAAWYISGVAGFACVLWYREIALSTPLMSPLRACPRESAL